MSPEPSFEEYRNNYERISIRRQILDAQINIVELFNNHILSQVEAEIIAAALAKVKNQRDIEFIKQEMEERGITDLQRIDYTLENQVVINDLRESFQEKLALINLDNWKHQFTKFIRQIKLHHPSIFQEDLVKGWLARILERVYGLYRQERIGALSFNEEITDVLRKVEHLPDFLAANATVIAGKRQPAFLESIEATLERLAIVEHLPEVFGGAIDGMIVGGSLSYGPFYNVRKNIDITGASDVDIICTLSAQNGNNAWTSLLHTDLIPTTDSERFIQRVQLFDELQARGDADIVSQRFRIVGRDFTVSAHFFPVDFFLDMNNKCLSSDLASDVDTTFLVQDYKVRQFEHPTCIQQSFNGDNYIYTVPKQVEIEDGSIATLPGYIIAERRFYPGLYQNLISPEFAVFNDVTGVTSKAVRVFQKLFNGRMQQEREARPNVSLAKSHIRNLVFAPERYID